MRIATGASVLAGLCSSVLLGACFELTANNNFQPDGTLQIAVEFGVSAQLLAMAQTKDSDPLAGCGNLQRMDEAPAGMKILKTSRGARGDKITCSVTVQIDDPVASAADFKRKVKDEDPLILDTFKLTRLGSNGYRLESIIETNPKKIASSPPGNSGAEALGVAMAAAMMANHYITVSVSAARIENSTGEMSNDNRTATWRMPVVLLVNPVSGYRQEIRADIIYSEGVVDKALRFLGLK